METLKVTSTRQSLDASVDLPLSKSISNRILIISAVSNGKVGYDSLSDAGDTVLLAKLLRQIEEGKDSLLQTGNAGTVFRFLTAYLSNTRGSWVLDGDERMRLRPIGTLVEALQELGADISYSGHAGYPPLKINGKPLAGGKVKIGSGISSQFVSALMMIAPSLPEGLIIELWGEFVSLPYIYLTSSMMKLAGAEVDLDLPDIKIAGKKYNMCTLPHEADWSAAAFWYELLALSKDGQLFLKGLKEDSLQGDRLLAKYFRLLGIETIYDPKGALLKKIDVIRPVINFDLINCPDLAPAMIVTTAVLGLEGNFYGLGALRIKESNRLEALATELQKMDIKCTIDHDIFSFIPQKMKIHQPVDTYNDHRMAMAFAPLAILGNPVVINDPEVVSKSYPGFWDELEKVLDYE